MKKIILFLIAVIIVTSFEFVPQNSYANNQSTEFSTTVIKPKKPKKPKSTRPKTVKVKSYKKKNGTIVKSHKRSAPRRK